MQVKRLIELLSELDPEAHVFIGDDNADTEVDYARSNGYRVLLTGNTSLYGLGHADGYQEAEDAYDDGVDDGWRQGVEHGKTADYKAAYADGYKVGVKEVTDDAYRRGYDRGFKDYPDHPYDSTPED